PVRAICADHSRPPRSISEENEILSEDANESRLCFQMRRDTDGPPVVTQKFAHWCASPGASENLIFFSSRLVHEYLGGSEPQRHKGHIINFGLFGPAKGDQPVAPTMIFLLLCPPWPLWLKSYLQFANTFFIRSTTSGGWTTTFFAIASSSWPVTGSTSQFRFCASALNSPSFSAFIKASRSIPSRSDGRPGGAISGRPMKSGAISTTAKRRVTSGAFRLSKISLTVGTSGKRGSRLGLPCTSTRVKPDFDHVRVGSLPKYPSRLPARHCTSPFCIARSISAAPGYPVTMLNFTPATSSINLGK